MHEDFGRIVGIVTERDLLRAVAQRARAAEARVPQWMTRGPVTIEPETTVEDAAKIMFEHNFRHLPVVKDGRSLGIVSLRMLSRWAFERSPSESVGPPRRVPAVIRLFPERGGWLEVVCGPMFSGKSEELIRRLRRAEIAGQRALIVKPRIDDRYDIGHVVSHAGAKMRAVAVVEARRDPGARGRLRRRSASTRCSSSTPEIVLAIDALVERGARVVAAGLDQDFRGAALRLDAGAALPSPSSSTSSRPSATAAAARRR